MSVQVQCEHCGAQFNLKDESKVGKRMKCPKCQSVFVVSAAEDDFGGTPLPKKSSGKSSSKGKKKGSKKKSSDGLPVLPLAIGGGVLLVAIIGVVLFLLFSTGEQPAPAQPVAAVEETPEAEPAEEPAPVTDGIIKTAWLLAETELVIHFQPARLLESALLKPVVDSPFAGEFLNSFRQQSGFGLADIESLTVGIAAPWDMLGTGGGLPPMGMGAGGAPQAPDLVAVMRLKRDVAAAQLPFLGPASPASGGTPAIHRIKSGPLGGFGPPPTDPALLGGVDDPAMIATTETETSESGSSAEGVSAPPFPAEEVGVVLPNSKILVIGQGKVLSKLKGTPNAALVKRFDFVKREAGVVVAVSLVSLPRHRDKLVQQAAMVSPDQKQSLDEILALYDQGARGALVSIDLGDGARIGVGLGAENDEAATALREPVEKWINDLKQSIETEAPFLSDLLRGGIAETLNDLQPQQEGSAIGFTIAFSPEVMSELQLQAQQMAAGLMMAGMSGPGLDSFGLGGGMPGLPGMPEMPPQPQRRIVSGSPQPAASSEGLPDGVELSAVAAWISPRPVEPSFSIDFKPAPATIDPNMNTDFETGGVTPSPTPNPAAAGQMSSQEAIELPEASSDGPVIAVDLVLNGSAAENVVQFKRIDLKSPKTAAGQPLKQRRAVALPHATVNTWMATESVEVEELGGDRRVVPVQFDPPAGDVQTISELSGEVILRIADEIGEKDIPMQQLAQLQQAEDDGMIRIVPLPNAAVKSVYIGPSNENVAILEVSAPQAVPELPPSPGRPGTSPQALAAMMSQTGGGAFPVAGGGPEMTLATEGTEMTTDDASQQQYGGGPAKTVAEHIVITRPPQLSPQGFIVVLGKSGIVRVRAAIGIREQPVSFSFSNLTLPERNPDLGEPQPPWTEIASRDGLPEGIETIFARGEWAEAVADNRRRTLNVLIDVVGPAAARASAVGIYQLDNCTADDKKLLTLDERNAGFKELPRGFDLPDPEQRGTSTPPDAYRLNFPMNAVDPQFSGLAKFTGSFRLRIAQQQPELIVQNLKQFVGKRILHEELNAERVLLNLSQNEEERTITVTVPRNARDKIASIDPVDRNGLLDPSVVKEVSVEKNDELHKFHVGDRRLDHLGLRIILYKGLQVVRVPFNFENLPVPPASVPED